MLCWGMGVVLEWVAMIEVDASGREDGVWSVSLD